MGGETLNFDRVRAAFGLSAATAILFNTVLACAKDAYGPLKGLMASLGVSDWMTQGLADLGLFVLMGLILLNTDLPERIKPKRQVLFLVTAAVSSGAGLFAWYALH